MVAAGAAAAAAIASWLALRQVRRDRADEAREGRLDAVQTALLGLKLIAPTDIMAGHRTAAARSSLLIAHEALDLRDRLELPSTTEAVAQGVTPEVVENALLELARLRGRNR